MPHRGVARKGAADVRLFFDDPGATRLDSHETADLGHGRSEVRRHVVCHEVDWLTGERRHPGAPRFPGLKAVAMVEATVGRGETTSVERRHFLILAPPRRRALRCGTCSAG